MLLSPFPLPGYGGSLRNATTRVFESKHQAAKRTNTNRKEGHVQQVRRQAFLQAVQHIARGDPWEAVVVDPKTGLVTETKLCFPGPKLVELIRAKYPSLNPYISSTATVKDQGSSISVQDDEVFHNLSLTRDNVDPRLAVRGEASRRPALVRIQEEVAEEGGLSSLLHMEPGSRNSVVVCPPPSQYLAAASVFPGAGLVAGWYKEVNVCAYKALDVFPRGVAVGDPRRQKILSLVGALGVGSYVTVSLPSG